jgi:hypothetical protein
MNPPISGQNMAELYDGALLLDAVDPSSGYAPLWSNARMFVTWSAGGITGAGSGP